MKIRQGHSLVEMLVVLIIVVALLAIAVATVQRARESARMTQCISRQTDLAQVVQTHVATDAFGRYTGYRAYAEDGTKIGWAAQLFEQLGRSDLIANPTKTLFVETLVCPSDQGPRDGPRMNYVVNGGKAGVDSTAEGIFFNHARNIKRYITNEDFKDGLKNTILLAENVDATRWDNTDEASQCILWPLTDGNEINAGQGSRPSSHHPGGFVAAFADGSVKFMTETEMNNDSAIHTEGSIYTGYLTPGGLDNQPLAFDGPGPDPCYPPDEGPQIDKGLSWLARHMFSLPDGTGYWSLVHSTHPDCDGACDEDAPAANARGAISAATALAILPMLGSGNTTASGPYRNEVCRGIAYLMAQQDQSTGQIADPGWGRRDYSHLLATLALSEALILSDHSTEQCPEGYTVGSGCNVDMDELRTAVELAIGHMIARQQANGGWGYGASDISHHGWGIGAFMAAQRAGVTVDSAALAKAQSFLTNVSLKVPVVDNGVTLGSSYSYNGGAGTTRNTAQALMCELLLGAPRDHPAIINFITGVTPSNVPWGGTYRIYTNQSMSIIMNAVGDPYKSDWNQAIQDVLLPAQVTAGHAQGSWSMWSPRSLSGNWV